MISIFAKDAQDHLADPGQSHKTFYGHNSSMLVICLFPGRPFQSTIPGLPNELL